MTTDKTAIRKVTRKRGAKAQKAPLKSRTISNDLIPYRRRNMASSAYRRDDDAS